MKGTNPIIPSGMNFDGAQRGRSKMRMAVVVVVLLHVALFAGILFQACSKTEEDTGAGVASGQKPSLAEEMAQVANQQPEVVQPTPTTQPLPPLPSAGNGLPPLPTTQPLQFGSESTTPGLPPDPSTFGAGTLPLPVHPAPVALVPPAPIATGTQHTIASGDNFWNISKKYGVKHRDIVAANPTVIPTRMKIGQKINIPPKAIVQPTPAPTVANDGTTYTVKSGDTLGHIALRMKVKLQTLKTLNPKVIPTQMKIGQKLKLPATSQLAPVAPISGFTPQVDPATGLPVLPVNPGQVAPLPTR